MSHEFVPSAERVQLCAMPSSHGRQRESVMLLLRRAPLPLLQSRARNLPLPLDLPISPCHAHRLHMTQPSATDYHSRSASLQSPLLSAK